MTKIVITEPDGYPDTALKLLQQWGEVVSGPFSRTELEQQVTDADVLIIRFAHEMNSSLLQHAKHLSVISCAATGQDHLDLEYCQQNGITVQTLKGETDFLKTITATAELTWWHILNLVRRADRAVSDVRNGGWDRDSFIGTQLYGKTLGIMGVGRLGVMVANYAKSFGMKVLGCDPSPLEQVDGMTIVSDRVLFAQSDIISVHVNLTSVTEGLIGKRLLSKVRKGAVLVNTARGDLIDEQALLEALDGGRLAAVGLDVLAGEGIKGRDWPHSNIIWRKMQNDPRIVITPHIGGATTESMIAAETFMAEKLVTELSSRNRRVAV